MPLVQTDLKSPVAGAQGRWMKLKLDNIREQLWKETKAGMLWAVPHFSDIWLAMMIDRDGEQAWFTDQVPTAATDDKFLYINMVWFFKLSLDERLFVSSHEIMHAMYGHAGMMFMLKKAGEIKYEDGVSLKFDPELMNYAADYVINDQLIQAKIGKMPEKGLHWPELITGDMDVLAAYRKLWEERKKQPQPPPPPQGAPCDSDGEGDGDGGDSKSQPKDPRNQSMKRTTKSGKDGNMKDAGAGSGEAFDELLRPGQGRGVSANKAISERNEGEWNVAIQAAMEAAASRGLLPANLQRMFGRKLQPKAYWGDVLQMAIQKRIGNDRYTWERLEPQFIYRGIGAPGRTANGCDLVVVVRDSSGSINDRTCEVFGAETRGALEQIRPKRVIIIDCDAMVHRYEEIDDLAKLEEPAYENVLGGGGTSFVPPFEKLEQEGEIPDLVIYLTDCFGDYPKRPEYPVVWGNITPRDQLNLCGHDYTPPWGEIVDLPQQQEIGSQS